MITEATILKNGTVVAQVMCQNLLVLEEDDELDMETLLAGGVLEDVRHALSECFSQILHDDVDVVFPELE